MQYLKIDVRQENMVLSLKCGKQQGVNKDVMFVFAREKKIIMLSVLSVFYISFL